MEATIIEKVNENQCFYGALIRGAQDSVEKYIKEQLSNASIREHKSIGNGEVLLKLNCLGYQIDCQSDKYTDLAFAIFTTLGAWASLYVKKAGSTELTEYEVGEGDKHNDFLQIYNECPDKTIWEKYVLCNCGEAVEFKYEPSAYVLSMVNDATLDENASAEPKASSEYIEDYDDAVYEEDHVVLM